MTDEPRTPRRWAGLCTTSFSSTMSTMRSTIKPTLRPASEYTTTCMRASPAAAAASLPAPATIRDRRMSGMICPRYCITSCAPASSIDVMGNSSDLATSDDGMAMRPCSPHCTSKRVWWSVAHDGCAGVSADPLQLFAQRLDDDLLGIGDLIDHQAKLATVGLHHHDVRGGVPGCLLPGLGYDLQFAVEIDQRQQASPS